MSPGFVGLEFNVNKSIIQYLKRKATLNSAKVTSTVCGEAMEKMEKWVNKCVDSHDDDQFFKNVVVRFQMKEIYSHITEGHEYVTIFWASVLL